MVKPNRMFAKKEGVSKFAPSFFIQSPSTFTSWGFVITCPARADEDFVSLGIRFILWQMIHFRPYNPKQLKELEEPNSAFSSKNR